MRRPSARVVRRIFVRSNAAISNRTVVVPSVISDSSPPITPAMPVALVWSAIISISGVSARSLPSSVVMVSPGLARRTMIWLSFTLARSKACIGWPVSSIT